MQLEYFLWNGVPMRETEINHHLQKIADKEQNKRSNVQSVKKLAISENFGDIVLVLDDKTVHFSKSVNPGE